MTKQEREKLREYAERNIQADREHYTVIHANPIEMIALLDHIDALEEKIKSAFYEGWNCGNIGSYPREMEWNNSKTKAAIASGPKCQTCNGQGMIGGFVSAENGYQSDPCPDCNSACAPEGK